MRALILTVVGTALVPALSPLAVATLVGGTAAIAVIHLNWSRA